MNTIETPGSGVAVEYAGFWLRFVAYLIDGLLLSLVYFVVMVPIFTLMGITFFTHHLDLESLSDEELAGMIIGLMGALGAAVLAISVLGWLYFAFMESSPKQATLGKLALGIKVTDIQGGRIDFMQASGRYFGKVVSNMILWVGFIMAAFTEKKQALHDIMSGCLVVKGS